jgi:HEAT repeat protein
MGPVFLRRGLSWQCCGLIAGACALLLPAVSRATDPVHQVRAPLKIEPGLIATEQEVEKSPETIAVPLKELKTISQLRRAYKESESEKLRDEIGKSLAKAIETAAKDPNVDKLAIGILIAEIADEELSDPKVMEKFARRLTGVALELAEVKYPTKIRQAALHALGKVTPDPKLAFPVLKSTLKETAKGPRRIAAYALTDLVKNAPHLRPEEKLATIREAIRTGAGAVQDSDDEWVRGYSLQAIRESAKIIADHLSDEYVLGVGAKKLPGKDKKRPVELRLTPELQDILKTYQEINPQLLKALEDPELNVRLTAVQALSQIAMVRSEIVRIVRETALENELDQLLKSFYASDPLTGIVGELKEKISPLLERKEDGARSPRKDDPRMRRGVIDFLELLGDQAAPAIEGITEALRDPDRLVKWSAARTIRQLPPKNVGDKAVLALAYNLLVDGDPDLTAAAADALEALGRLGHDPAKGGRLAAREAVSALAIVIAGVGPENRGWDPENRVKAMKALVSIGGPAQAAIPKILPALKDSDVRVRRQAAETLGRLRRPGDEKLARDEIAALNEALRDEDAQVRLSASEAILSIAPTK